MRVLIAGATGVLGSRVVRRLLDEGHAVTGIGRSPERLAQLSRLGMTPVASDLLDAGRIGAAMRGHQVVINLATSVPRGARMFLPGAWKPMDRVRRDGSRILADAVIANGVERFIQESFAPIYADSGDEWITESYPTPAASYNRSVLDAEESARRVAATGASAEVVRFGFLYGPGDPFATQLISSVRRGWMPLPGRRDAFLPLVTHDDAAAAVVAALGVPGGPYNVVDDRPMTRQAIGDALAGLLGVKPPRFPPGWLTPLFGSLGGTIARSLRVSNEKLRNASAWAPATTDAREGLRLALEAERAQPVARRR